MKNHGKAWQKQQDKLAKKKHQRKLRSRQKRRAANIRG